MTNAKAIKEIERVGRLISKYAHRWGEFPSDRLHGWVLQYDNLKADHPDAFREYCNKTGACPTHDACDCLA